MLKLLAQLDEDGSELSKQLARLLPLKTKAEYEPDDIPQSAAEKAVARANSCMEMARRIFDTR